jgi:hypothetical protein
MFSWKSSAKSSNKLQHSMTHHMAMRSLPHIKLFPKRLQQTVK